MRIANSSDLKLTSMYSEADTLHGFKLWFDPRKARLTRLAARRTIECAMTHAAHFFNLFRVQKAAAERGRFYLGSLRP